MRKSKRVQFGIAALLILTSIVALLLAESLQPGWRGFAQLITLGFIQIIGFATCAEVLTRNIPRSLSRAQRSNCVRRDGTWSKRREAVEERSLQKLRRELAKSLLLVAVVMNLILGFIDNEIIPIPIAVDVLTSFRINESEWKAHLRDNETRFDSWLGLGHARKQSSVRKKVLWHSWPLAGTLGLLWLFSSFAFVANTYGHSLKNLESSVRFRAEQYSLRGLHAAVGNDEFAKVVPREHRNGLQRNRPSRGHSSAAVGKT